MAGRETTVGEDTSEVNLTRNDNSKVSLRNASAVDAQELNLRSK